jgi:hypothetical protein
MKRTLIAAALLLGTMLSAHADTSYWDNITKQPRGDDQLHADARYCDLTVGVSPNGVPTPPWYKKCMLSRGWRYTNERHDGTYINRRGMSCKPILNGGGTECSSF